MGLKLSLTAKGLMLVSIPILFEVGFVWALVNLQHETEVEAQQAIKTRDISQRLNGLLHKIYETWQVFDAAKQNSSDTGSGLARLTDGFFKIYKSNYRPRFRSMTSDYAALEELTKDRPDFNMNVKKASKSLEQANSILDEAFVDVNSGRFDVVATRYRQMEDKVLSLYQDLTTQNMALEAKAEHDAAELGAQRSAASRQLMIGIVMSVLCPKRRVFCLPCMVCI
jgi:hypothetical protein